MKLTRNFTLVQHFHRIKYTRRKDGASRQREHDVLCADFGNGLARQNIGRLLKVGMRMCRGNLIALDIRLARNGPFWREAAIHSLECRDQAKSNDVAILPAYEFAVLFEWRAKLSPFRIDLRSLGVCASAVMSANHE